MSTPDVARPERTLLEVIISIVVPPVGAFAAVGLTGQFWLNVLLTILGYIPGVLHAIWLSVRD